MANMDVLLERQVKTLEKARSYGVSEDLCALAVIFAVEQRFTIYEYQAIQGLFVLSDGEPYTADYILKYFGR